MNPSDPPGPAAQPAAEDFENPGLTEEFLHKFGQRLARLLAPHVDAARIQEGIQQVIDEANAASARQAAPPVQPAQPPRPAALELAFVHDCRNHGCNRLNCVLCKHNPNKRCRGNFAHKYWVGDRLLAKCDGEIQVELINIDTQQTVSSGLQDACIEVSILDGNKYNTRCREAGEQRSEIMDECEVLLNQKQEPLLTAGGCHNDLHAPKVTLNFNSITSSVPLRDLKVTESSESVLAGTKRPPFRIVVRAVRPDGSRIATIRPAVSEEFVVVTKRTKNLKKQDIPSLDDPISKLNHIGKETVKKLNELMASADEAQLDIDLPEELHKITKVRDFQQLARLSEADGHLQLKLKQLLKLSKEKWDASCDHAKMAVQVDNRMRAWYLGNMAMGLLYTCSLGDIQADAPVALVQNRRQNGADVMEVVPMDHQLPGQREQVQSTTERALESWWEEGHPGWMIFSLGTQHFETLDEIIRYSRSDGGRAMPMNLADLPQEGSVQLRGQLPLDQGAGLSNRLEAMDMWRHPKDSDLPPFPRPDGKNESNMSEQRGLPQLAGGLLSPTGQGQPASGVPFGSGPDLHLERGGLSHQLAASRQLHLPSLNTLTAALGHGAAGTPQGGHGHEGGLRASDQAEPANPFELHAKVPFTRGQDPEGRAGKSPRHSNSSSSMPLQPSVNAANWSSLPSGFGPEGANEAVQPAMLQSLLSLNAFAQAGGHLGPAAGSLAHFASLGNLASIESLSSFNDVREYLAANGQGLGGSLTDETAAGILRESFPALMQQQQRQGLGQSLGGSLAALDHSSYRQQLGGGLPDTQLRAYDRQQPSRPPQRQLPDAPPPSNRFDPFSSPDQQLPASRGGQQPSSVLSGRQQGSHPQQRQQQQQGAPTAPDQSYLPLPDARWGAQQQHPPQQTMQWAHDSSRFAAGPSGYGDRHIHSQPELDRSSFLAMGANDMGFDNQGPGSPSARAPKRQAMDHPRMSHDRSSEDRSNMGAPQSHHPGQAADPRLLKDVREEQLRARRGLVSPHSHADQPLQTPGHWGPFPPGH